MGDDASLLLKVLHENPVPTIVLKIPSWDVQYVNLAAKRIIGSDASNLEEMDIAITSDDLIRVVEKRKDKDDRAETHVQRHGQMYRIDLLNDRGETRALIQIEHTDLAADFRSLYDTLPVMVSQKTEADFFYNNEFLQFTGQNEQPGQVLGYLDAVHPDDRISFEQALLFHDHNLDSSRGNSGRSPTRVDHAHRLRNAANEYRWSRHQH